MPIFRGGVVSFTSSTGVDMRENLDTLLEGYILYLARSKKYFYRYKVFLLGGHLQPYRSTLKLKMASFLGTTSFTELWRFPSYNLVVQIQFKLESEPREVLHGGCSLFAGREPIEKIRMQISIENQTRTIRQQSSQYTN